MQIILSNRAYVSIISETAEKIKTETGGIFLGCFDNGTWYIVEAIDPGPKSVFQPAYFEYDQKYTAHLINKTAKLYQSKLALIGLWHRHPGSFDRFSATDNATNTDYAKLSSKGAVSLLVNIDPTFRITAYHVSLPLCYTKIPYKTGDEFMPEHLLKLKTPEQILKFINGYADKSHAHKSVSAKPNVDFARLIDGIKTKFEPVSFKLTNDDIKSEEHRDLLIDALLEDITYFSETRGLALNVEQNKGFIYLSHKGANGTLTKLCFAYMAKEKQIVFFYGDTCYIYNSGLFAGLGNVGKQVW